MFNYHTVNAHAPIKHDAMRNSVTTVSSHTPFEAAQAMFVGTSGWQDAGETIRQNSFDCLPRITHDYGMSFLI
jgi:hypothetical protein